MQTLLAIDPSPEPDTPQPPETTLTRPPRTPTENTPSNPQKPASNHPLNPEKAPVPHPFLTILTNDSAEANLLDVEQ